MIYAIIGSCSSIVFQWIAYSSREREVVFWLEDVETGDHEFK